MWAAAAAVGHASADRVSDLKATTAQMKKDRDRMLMDIRNEERKKQRRMDIARGLTNEDFVAIMGERAAAKAKSAAKAAAKAAAQAKAAAVAAAKAGPLCLRRRPRCGRMGTVATLTALCVVLVAPVRPVTASGPARAPAVPR